jgi:hypothetical protein
MEKAKVEKWYKKKKEKQTFLLRKVSQAKQIHDLRSKSEARLRTQKGKGM